jgi:hypothetical protein
VNLHRTRYRRARHPGAVPVPSRDGASAEQLCEALFYADSTLTRGERAPRSQIADAKEAGATDLEIHDTVLIAAAFCMFNRYVDGLGTTASNDPAHYAVRADLTGGYLQVLADAQHEATTPTAV